MQLAGGRHAAYSRGGSSCLGRGASRGDQPKHAPMARFEHESRTVQADEDRRRGNPVPLAPVARAAPSPASRRPARWRTASLAAIYAISASMAAISPAAAQNLPLIRDTEIENLLKDYSIPIFKAAGLGSQNIAMRIVRHESFNAFVVDGHNVFINTGTLMQAKTPNEVIGVIAHETGHIVGGHLASLRSRIARDATKSLLLTILGIGLMVGGAFAGGEFCARYLRRRRRFGHGRQRHADALAAERAPRPGIGGRPVRPAALGGNPPVRPRHARDLRALRRAGVLVAEGPRPVRAQPPRRRASPQPAARKGGGEPLCQRQGPAAAAASPRHDARQARGPRPGPADRLQPLSRRATRACPRATRAPSPATARAAACRRSRRSMP